MSVNQLIQQQQQELQNELNITNQLLNLISIELNQIKEFTSQGGKFEANIKKNASTMAILGSFMLKNVDIENLPPVRRSALDASDKLALDASDNNLNQSTCEQDTSLDASNVNDSQ